MRPSILALSALGLTSGVTLADITVSSAIQLVEDGPGMTDRRAACVTCRIYAQAIITNPTGVPPEIARSIRGISGSIFISDPGYFGAGISVQRSLLSPQETYGAGFDAGWQSPPVNDDPASPWQGLMWPYRDLNDYPSPNLPDLPPTADEIGNVSYNPDLDNWRILNIMAGARGGPTEPDAFYNQTPGYLNRGITGNGYPGPASYFAFDVLVSAGTPLRNLIIEILGAQAVVVVENTQTGAWSEQVIDIPDFSTTLQVPTPGVLGLACFGLGLRLRRHR